MRLFRTLAMTFSMFSSLPMPSVRWEKENMRYTLSALPLVGILIGLCLYGWALVCKTLSIGPTLFAAGLTLLPVALSGGIHLDGFCDTVDALASHAPPEKKRAILKDPRAGAFAVIGVCCYLLFYFALCTELSRAPRTLLLFALTPVVSRACGGLASACFPSAGQPGLLTAFRDAAGRVTALLLCAWLVFCAAALLCLDPLAGGVMLLAAGLSLVSVYCTAKRAFGGMSGDLAGYGIALCELAMLFALILVQKAVTL